MPLGDEPKEAVSLGAASKCVQTPQTSNFDIYIKVVSGHHDVYVLTLPWNMNDLSNGELSLLCV